MNEYTFLYGFAVFLFGSLGSLILYGGISMIRDRLDRSDIVLGGIIILLGLSCFFVVSMAVWGLLHG